MTDILLEKKLTTDFTMGFELECIWNTGEDDEDWDTAEEQANDFFEDWFPGGDLHSDGSLRPTRDVGGTPVEWASPVLPLNVATFQKIINMYKEGLGRNKNFYVNNSCGYHHHISFPGMTAEDMVWIMCKLAVNDGMREKISNFEGIEFVGEWSEDAYLDSLREAVENDNYSEIVSICATDKYSLVNVHAHNTLEWRGPRGFLNSANISKIVRFYERLWEFVKWMTDALDETEINNVSKDNFISQIKAAMGNNRTINGWKFQPEKRKDGLLTSAQLADICSRITANAWILTSYVKHNALEQILQHLYNTNRLGLRIKALNENSAVDKTALKKINSIAYKYIPYRMMYEYGDDVESEAYYNTSPLTMKRFLKTAKLNRQDVTENNKLNVLDSKCEMFNPTILSKENCPDIYVWKEWNLDTHNELFKLLVKTGYAKDLSIETVISMLKSLRHLPSYMAEEYFRLILSVFSGNPEAMKSISTAVLSNIDTIDPSLIAPYLNINFKQLIWLVGKIKSNHRNLDVDKTLDNIHRILIENNKITEEQWQEVMQMFRRSHEINPINNGNPEDEEVQGLEDREFDPED